MEIVRATGTAVAEPFDTTWVLQHQQHLILNIQTSLQTPRRCNASALQNPKPQMHVNCPAPAYCSRDDERRLQTDNHHPLSPLRCQMAAEISAGENRRAIRSEEEHGVLIGLRQPHNPSSQPAAAKIRHVLHDADDALIAAITRATAVATELEPAAYVMEHLFTAATYSCDGNFPVGDRPYYCDYAVWAKKWLVPFRHRVRDVFPFHHVLQQLPVELHDDVAELPTTFLDTDNNSTNPAEINFPESAGSLGTQVSANHSTYSVYDASRDLCGIPGLSFASGKTDTAHCDADDDAMEQSLNGALALATELANATYILEHLILAAAFCCDPHHSIEDRAYCLQYVEWAEKWLSPIMNRVRDFADYRGLVHQVPLELHGSLWELRAIFLILECRYTRPTDYVIFQIVEGTYCMPGESDMCGAGCIDNSEVPDCHLAPEVSLQLDSVASDASAYGHGENHNCDEDAYGCLDPALDKAVAMAIELERATYVMEHLRIAAALYTEATYSIEDRLYCLQYVEWAERWLGPILDRVRGYSGFRGLLEELPVGLQDDLWELRTIFLSLQGTYTPPTDITISLNPQGIAITPAEIEICEWPE